MSSDGYSVGRAAALAGVTVRTLHHYDEIGLLSPSERTPSGYRRYSASDLDRLRQVLYYRELGFPLPEIATILDDRTLSAAEHLRRQRKLLAERIARLQAMAAAVEKELEARSMGINLTPEEKFELFGPEYQEYEDEAQQRWGETEAWRQSQAKAAEYTKEDWARIKSEADALDRRIADAVRSGITPDSAEGMAVAEAHRQHIIGNFYDCGYEMHRCLARMFVSDERFTAHFEQNAPGGAAWMHDAIQANAARGEAVSR